MKIEIEVPEVTQGQVVDAIARQLLHRWSKDGPDADCDDADDDGEASRASLSSLGHAIRMALVSRVDEIAQALVTRHFDEAVRARIGCAIDAVLADGWHDTDRFGGRRGERMDLRALIGRLLSGETTDRSGNRRSLIDERVRQATEGLLDREMKADVEEARKILREKLDRAVLEKVAEVVTGALGLSARRP